MFGEQGGMESVEADEGEERNWADEQDHQSSNLLLELATVL